MVINFVGLFSQPSVTGEVSDETHLAREIESLGNRVVRVPRDVWKACCDGHPANPDWVLPDHNADINIICKWNHFVDGSYVDELKKESGGAPVFYWVWDWMNEFDPNNWNWRMAKASDLYLTGEGGLVGKYRSVGIPAYYFQMDVCDGEIPTFANPDGIYKHDLIFTGSWFGKGNRQEYLKRINREFLVTVFSWNHKDWPSEFDARPAVYGEEYNLLISESMTVLGFNVEPNCYGYWSNRIGKVLRAGGHLLQEYAPGMEVLADENIEFFSSPEEAIEKIRSPKFTPTLHTYRFTSTSKAQQLMVLVDRFIKKKESWII